VALIVAMSCITGVAYHLAAYGEPGSIPSFVQVGVLAASLFAVSNAFRGEYRLANFFAFRPHGRRTVRLWNVTFVCLLVLGFLAQISVGYSRGWIVLFYIATFAGLIVLRFAIVRLTALARSAGLVSAQRIFLIGTGAHVGAFVHRYEPWTLGASVVGCRFLTPTAATALAQERWATLERDLAEAVAGVRSLEPDAIFLLMPWSATEIIERCAETFLALPVEIHLGPEQILHKFETVELSRLGTLASLQPTRMPLSRLEIAQKRLFDLVFAAAGLLDEIPQLFNVLTGDMSLVGPRPHALTHDREYERRISLYARRHNVKPGITGWAQIHGLRGATDTEDKMRQRVEYDLFYIDNWSLWLDLTIIARTVLSRAAYRNAY
jgi:hypothetical protein